METPPKLRLFSKACVKHEGFDLTEKELKPMIERRYDYLEFVRYLQCCFLPCLAVRLSVQSLPRPSSMRLKHVEAENHTPDNI